MKKSCRSLARSGRTRLPCDALIYLGTGFCPSGWNTGHGSFRFNPSAFPDPKRMLDELHAMHYHVVPHVVIRSKTLRGTVHDRSEPGKEYEDHAASYWNAHREVFTLGVDGWWPDEGDPLDVGSRLARIRMYWEGPQLDRPQERPYALHRNGYAGMQRYAAFLWSGDVNSTWETLRTHVPVAINTALSGIPYWGTDTGGFVPTKELDWRALRSLVPVQRLLPALPIARTNVEAAATMGLEYRRTGPERDTVVRQRSQPRPRRTA